MRKIIVNKQADQVRTLSPFMYTDPIKSLEKSNEARVTLDGVRVHKSAVTCGRDVKNPARTMKYHLYFYPAQGAAREWMPISAEEFRAYKNDAGFVMELVTVEQPKAAEPAPQQEPAKAEEPAKPHRKAERAKA